MSPSRPGPVLRLIFRAPVRVYERDLGWLLGGRRRFEPVHRVLGEAEAMAVIADYERRNRWLGPVIRPVLSKLLGWRYDDTDTARRSLVRRLPEPLPPSRRSA